MENQRLLDELIELAAREPEDKTLEDMAKEGFIELCEEPEHSRSVLMGFQREYYVHSVDILNEGYRLASCVGVSDHDLSEWLWAIEQFIKAGGVLFDLPLLDVDEWITTHSTIIGTGPVWPQRNLARPDTLFALVTLAE